LSNTGPSCAKELTSNKNKARRPLEIIISHSQRNEVVTSDLMIQNAIFTLFN